MAPSDSTHVHLVGAGIASLSAAALLVRDAGVDGRRIRILEELSVPGGALDGKGDAKSGYVTRGGRMLTEETYVCLWDVLQGIPSLDRPGSSVKDDCWAFNAEHVSHARARLIDREHRILDARQLGFDMRDRVELMRLLATPEKALGAKRIEEVFSEHFFQTNFWAMWRTTFAFQNWHSAIELKRYMLRFLQEFPRIHTLGGVRRTRYNQYDTIVRPLRRWLEAQGVTFVHGTKVTDADFAPSGDGQRVTRLHAVRGGEPLEIPIGIDDVVLFTIGSMTADATYGGDSWPAPLVRDKRDGAWTLWENMARRLPNLGRPNTFCGNVDETKWLSFTMTMRNPLLLDRIEAFSGNAPGTGGLMTFKDSSWLMSIVVPHAPHFASQPEGIYTLWGYGLFVDQPGDYVRKPMADCTGQEILTELVHQLGFEDVLADVRASTTTIPVMMPYITSEFERRAVEDRPPVIPQGAANFALMGQYVEIAEDCVFTVEYSVRSAMQAVYGLFGVDKAIPPIYHAIADPEVSVRALHALLTSAAPGAVEQAEVA
jgi:oleate hydratase